MSGLEKLQQEIGAARKTIKTDNYSMSIGELINLYRDKEVILNPDFQRMFRWEDEQKTKLVESILIGIPIPEIFVAQQKDNTWHVVDGVQRLSTIFQLLGVLKGHEPLQLTSCKYLPSLKDLYWTQIPLNIQRIFKRAKIHVSIILSENSDEAQYELFQRLNTGGTILSAQEVRNCIILMLDKNFYKVLNEIKEYPVFKECLNLPEHHYDEEYHMECALRMYIGVNGVEYDKYPSLGSMHISDFIDEATVKLISKQNINIEEFSEIFKKTFDKVRPLGKKIFRRYSKEEDSFKGAFNVSVFEMVSVGVATNISTIENISDDDLIKKIKGIYELEVSKNLLERGVRPIRRFRGLTEMAKEYFA